MTPLTPVPRRRELFFAWFGPNLAGTVVSVLLLAGATFALMLGIVYAAMGGQVLLGAVFGLAALPLGIAGVAALGAFQGQVLGLSRRDGGLFMLLAALAAAVQFVLVPILFAVLLPARRSSLAFHPLEVFIVPLTPGMGGLVLGWLQAAATPWLRPRKLAWTLTTGLAWFLGGLTFGGAYLAFTNARSSVTLFAEFWLALPALGVVIAVTGLAYAYLRSLALVEPVVGD